MLLKCFCVGEILKQTFLPAYASKYAKTWTTAFASNCYISSLAYMVDNKPPGESYYTVDQQMVGNLMRIIFL
jgi:hypothetical protein